MNVCRFFYDSDSDIVTAQFPNGGVRYVPRVLLEDFRKMIETDYYFEDMRNHFRIHDLEDHSFSQSPN